MPDKKQIMGFLGIVAAVIVGHYAYEKVVSPMVNKPKIAAPATA